ncbi:M23 family metallopeptidase [Thermosediminibacter litoriperuensis]|uniref:Peptidase M23-like protein n=1 Tax=Thermosediminibacter litoriperuensis TaxID=291989 RepID=A0A5S5AWU9_9FIRM|nr:M23 family metallopeptidase [Thermosediminibacter litoriperuensis]TYP56841.1 peptidase M23-like protein [Thermosediminibacter litoriperuensis]
MHFVGRLILAFLPEPEKVIKFLLIAFFIPAILLILLFAGPIVAYERVPLAAPSQIKIYVDAAEKVSETTKNPYSEGVNVDWRPLVAIDAVRFKQDFSKATTAGAERLAEMFIEKTDEIEVEEGDPPVVRSYPIYRLRSLDEVLDELIFSEEEKEKVKEFLSIDLSSLRDVGTGVPPGWMPSEGFIKWPLPGIYSITSGFGPRIDPVHGTDGFHKGIDIAAATGTPVVAAADGRVAYAGWCGGYGIAVFIWHENGMETRYAHLSGTAVKPLQEVKAGEIIGYVGSTGKSTGPHLHFEVMVGGKAVNPIDFFN